MTKNKTILLISVRSKYVQLMMDGRKTVELRKSQPRVRSGDFVLIYECAPVKALVAVFRVKSLSFDEPKKLWPKVKNYAGISKEDFDVYYGKSGKACGIWLDHVKNLPEKLTLSQIREAWSNFRPPQSYCYLSEDQITSLEEIFKEPILPRNDLSAGLIPSEDLIIDDLPLFR